MLPRLGGFAVLRAARAARVRSPVLMLTARDAIADKVAGLDAGADYYLTKPFSVRRVSRARARAPAPGRRTARAGPEIGRPHTRPRHARGGAPRPAHRAHRPRARAPRILPAQSGRVLTRPLLAEHVWGLDFDPESNVVDVYVGYLRRKIDGPGDARCCSHGPRRRGTYLRPDSRLTWPASLSSIHTRLTLWYTACCWRRSSS